MYEFTAGKKPDTVHWRADKVVNGRRDSMGELDLVYNVDAGCWSAEFASPRVRIVWCLTVTGTHISGTASLLPGKQNVRKVDVDKR